VKSETKKLIERVQALLLQMGTRGLKRYGMKFMPIDNNPRHGMLSVGRGGAVEVVQRLGQWWVMPQRR
jgi:hypothetical protein